MVTEVANALQARGFATLVPDLYGTGDSFGNFGDADLETWQADVLAACRWAESEHCPVTQCLGVRLGCTIAAVVAESLYFPRLTATVFWQPVLDGQRFLTQFLRLRIAANLQGSASETVGDLRKQLSKGECVEVAGYNLSPTLALGVDALRLAAPLPASLGSLLWLEAVRGDAPELAVPSRAVVDAAVSAGQPVSTQLVAGEPFWAATEVVVNKAFVAATENHVAVAAD
jgi:exosortase A-associated hydrolase 2